MLTESVPGDIFAVPIVRDRTGKCIACVKSGAVLAVASKEYLIQKETKITKIFF